MQLPKDCYYLADVLIEQMKQKKTSFTQAIDELNKPGIWVEIDWRASTPLQKKEIRSTPVLLISYKEESIIRSFASYSQVDMNNFVKQGGQIFMSASVVDRWGYKKKK